MVLELLLIKRGERVFIVGLDLEWQVEGARSAAAHDSRCCHGVREDAPASGVPPTKLLLGGGDL